MDTQKLIAEYIETGPELGPESARLVDSGVDVWVLVMYYQRAANQEVAVVAHDYYIPVEAVEAVLAYYEEHKDAIDARVTSNLGAAA